jgi:hypothetical protein
MHGNGGEAEMQSISETEADEPSRGRRIFQQKNICDRADAPLAHGEIVSVSTLVERRDCFREMMHAERAH